LSEEGSVTPNSSGDALALILIGGQGVGISRIAHAYVFGDVYNLNDLRKNGIIASRAPNFISFIGEIYQNTTALSIAAL